MVKLSDGRELTADMNKIRIREYRQLFDKDQPQAEEDVLIGRVYGLSGEEIAELGQYDYRLLVRDFFAAARDPLPDAASG